jgi:hypothetical protein
MVCQGRVAQKLHKILLLENADKTYPDKTDQRQYAKYIRKHRVSVVQRIFAAYRQPQQNRCSGSETTKLMAILSFSLDIFSSR